MGHFSDLLANFQYNLMWFLRYPWHATYHFTLFSPTIMMEMRTFHFRIPLVQGGGAIFPFFKVNFRGPMKWDLSLLIYPWHVTYHFTVFSLIKTMEISKFHFRTTIVQGGGGNFSHFDQFLWDLWKVTSDYWYNHGMWPRSIILVYFFST